MIKFYDIDKGYVQYLQTIDRQIPNIHYKSNNKFVCGIVLSVNNVTYYAPISHFNKKQQTNLLIYDKGNPISSIRFSFMIPAYGAVLKEKDFSIIAKYDKKYADLLNTEYRYCSTHEEQIKRKAQAVYRIGCNKNHKLNYTCCDFKLLEQFYKDYNLDTNK